MTMVRKRRKWPLEMENLQVSARRVPLTALPDTTPLFTAKRCLLPRAHDPIVAAFLHAENLKPRIRKLTHAQWIEELDQFRSASRFPRG